MSEHDEEEQYRLERALDVAIGVSERTRHPQKLPVQVVLACGGAALALWCSFCFLNVLPGQIGTARLWYANLVLLLFGIVAALYEAPAVDMPALHFLQAPVHRTREYCEEWARSFAVMWGRGLLYLNVGVLNMLGFGLYSGQGICGMYLVLMGVLLVIFYIIAARELAADRARWIEEVRQQYPQLENRFLDLTQGKRHIDYKEFENVFRQLADRSLTAAEVRKATRRLDANGDYRIDCEEFIAWYVAASAKPDQERSASWMGQSRAQPGTYQAGEETYGSGGTYHGGGGHFA
eukprot:TRINITY_DN12189_c0_g1_i1.p1 TRINITY_DN12189_c0_g1~~TRINITY_DN12189_c0_g1_i1.p1  ORF type:complete len:321 (+),score=91.33 TRINITY_DN12189_c0_g1_i1:88-963(+)